jgi:3-hydroxyisobutyrate dehydrogenase-like beta-hydroxyacid dehydrogenase
MLEASVIGLGTMGATLARLLLQNRYRVTVWNRMIAKADPLVRDGAVLAPSPAAAVGASPIVVVCVHDYPATNKILDTKEVAAALAGRMVCPRAVRLGRSWRWNGWVNRTSYAASKCFSNPGTGSTAM